MPFRFRAFSRTALMLVLILACGYARSKKKESLDLAKAIEFGSQIPCDGQTNPQQDVVFRPTFSPGDSERIFIVDAYQEEYCRVDAGIRCLKKEQTGWKDDWQTSNFRPSASTRYPLNSCRTWGAKDQAKYTISGWYKTGGPKDKQPPVQAKLTQVGSDPDIFQFADPAGATATLEMRRR